MMRGVGHVIHRAIECFLVRVRRLGESAKFPDKLQRRCANFVIRRPRLEIMQGLDGSTHVETINTSRSTINYFALADNADDTIF